MKKLLLLLPLMTALTSPAGEIRGRVFLSGGRAASGVSVLAMPYEAPLDASRREAKRGEAPKPLATVTTSSDGGFALRVTADAARPESLFQVRIQGGGVVPTLLEGLYDAGEVEDLGDMTLPRAEKIAGRVVVGSGQPVAGATVTLRPGRERVEDGPDHERTTRSVETGADGTFRFDEATGVGNAITVEKAGLAPASVPSLRSGAVAKPIALAKGSELSGIVKKTDKKTPAAGALVRFEGAGTTRWVETGADGAFRIPNAPDGKGNLVVDGGEMGYAAIEGLRLPIARKLSATLTPPARLEGHAVDSRTGKSIPRVKIQVGRGASMHLARTGPDGAYRVSPLSPGSVRVLGDEPRYVPYSRDAAIASGETKKLDLPLVLGASMTGRVSDEAGQPIAGAKGLVSRGGENDMRAFFRLMREAARADLKTNPDGTFRASRLMPGENQKLTLRHPEFEVTTLTGLALTPGATKTGVLVVMRRGVAIAGFVKDKDGNPVADADVSIANAPGMRMGRGGMALSAMGPGGRPSEKTGPDGRFEIKALSPGDYMMVVAKNGYATERVDPVKVGDEPPKEPLVVTLLPGAAIRGTVRSKSGNGLEGYMVSARSGGSSRGMGLFAGGVPNPPTGPDGVFTLEGLKSGESYELQVFGGSGLGPMKRGVVAPADGVEIVMSGNGKIAGVALDVRTGRPLTTFSVSYEPDRGQGGGGGMVFRFANRTAGTRVTGAGERTEVKGEDGAFVLDDVPAGKWQVVVEAKGYQTAHVGGVAVEEDKTTPNLEVKVAPGGALKGHVTDARSGRPIPDATAVVEDPGARGPFGMNLGGEEEVTTDADGRFEIEGLAPGKHKVVARHADYTEASETVEVKENGAVVELRMSTGGVIAGTVLSPGRQALSGVNVGLSAAGEPGFGRAMGMGGQTTTTDPGGRFRFDHLGAGRYEVSASLRGATSAPADVVLQAGESNESVALTLSAGATIRGVVSGLPEASRAGVMVTANGPQGFFSSTRTGADGSFELTGAPSGAITLRATAGDFLSGTRSGLRQISVEDGQTEVAAEIVLESGYALTGRVLKGSEPVPGANVFAFAQGSGRSASARADDGGSYRLEGLQKGTYNVNASAPSGTGSKSQTVDVSSDQNLDLVIPLARLAGTVVEAGSRQPLSEATVELDSSEGRSPFLRSYRTDSNGGFSLEDLDPKSHTLTVRKADFLFEKRSVVAAEQGSDNLVIELTRGEGIGVQVRDGIYGVPLRGMMARVLDAQKTPVFIGGVSLDDQGRGEIPSLKPGRYTVIVDASGYAAQTLDGINVPSPSLPIALTPGGSVEIHAGPDTLARSGARLQFLTGAGVPYYFSFFTPDGTMMLGTAIRRIDNFAPGTYLLSVTGGAAKSFTVAEGRTTIVELP